MDFGIKVDHHVVMQSAAGRRVYRVGALLKVSVTVCVKSESLDQLMGVDGKSAPEMQIFSLINQCQ